MVYTLVVMELLLQNVDIAQRIGMIVAMGISCLYLYRKAKSYEPTSVFNAISLISSNISLDEDNALWQYHCALHGANMTEVEYPSTEVEEGAETESETDSETGSEAGSGTGSER